MRLPMNPPAEQHPAHPESNLERINQLILALEQELARAPADLPQVQTLRKEIDALKQTLASPEKKEEGIGERLHSIFNGLQDMTQRVEGEVLKDSPYIVELGRIVGLV